MRKIEQQMCRALNMGVMMRKDNTSVMWNRADEHGQLYAEVRLHGHIIGEYHPTEQQLWLGDAGWQTPTTKSRLNALITEFVSPSSGISQRDWQWYLRHDGAELKWTGEGVLDTTK